MTEVIVVAGLIVIVGALALGNYRGQLPRYRQEQCTYELAAELRAARAQSQSFNVPVQVSLDTAAARYTAWADRNTNGAVDPGEQTVVDLDAGRQVSLQANASGGGFDRRGRFNCSNGCWTVAVKASGLEDRTIRVLPGGQVDWTGQ